MQQEQFDEIMNHPEVASAAGEAKAAGLAESVIKAAISTAIGSTPAGELTAVVAEAAARCILKKIKKHLRKKKA